MKKLLVLLMICTASQYANGHVPLPKLSYYYEEGNIFWSNDGSVLNVRIWYDCMGEGCQDLEARIDIKVFRTLIENDDTITIGPAVSDTVATPMYNQKDTVQMEGFQKDTLYLVQIRYCNDSGCHDGFRRNPQTGDRTTVFYYTRSTGDATSITEPHQDHFAIENPFEESMAIVSDVPARMILFDLSGREIMHADIVSGSNKLSVPDIPTGMYVARVITADGTFGRKVVKR